MLIAALVVAGSGSAVFADACSDPQDQATMNECADKALRASDADLNVAFKQIKARLTEDAAMAKLLVAAQRNWIQFRDAECKFSSSAVAQGSVYPMIYAMCLDDLTKARTEQLKTYLNCPEGDLACPVPTSN